MAAVDFSRFDLRKALGSLGLIDKGGLDVQPPSSASPAQPPVVKPEYKGGLFNPSVNKIANPGLAQSPVRQVADRAMSTGPSYNQKQAEAKFLSDNATFDAQREKFKQTGVTLGAAPTQSQSQPVKTAAPASLVTAPKSMRRAQPQAPLEAIRPVPLADGSVPTRLRTTGNNVTVEYTKPATPQQINDEIMALGSDGNVSDVTIGGGRANAHPIATGNNLPAWMNQNDRSPLASYPDAQQPATVLVENGQTSLGYNQKGESVPFAREGEYGSLTPKVPKGFRTMVIDGSERYVAGGNLNKDEREYLANQAANNNYVAGKILQSVDAATADSNYRTEKERQEKILAEGTAAAHQADATLKIAQGLIQPQIGQSHVTTSNAQMVSANASAKNANTTARLADNEIKLGGKTGKATDAERSKIQKSIYDDTLKSFDWTGFSPTTTHEVATVMAKTAGQGYGTISDPGGKYGDAVVHPEIMKRYQTEISKAKTSDQYAAILDRMRTHDPRAVYSLPVKNSSQLKRIKQAKESTQLIEE